MNQAAQVVEMCELNGLIRVGPQTEVEDEESERENVGRSRKTRVADVEAAERQDGFVRV